MDSFGPDVLVPWMLFAIPAVAVMGAVLAGVVKTISAHRLVEAAVRERLALAARGHGPAALAAATRDVVGYARLRAQGLLVWGLALLAGGAALAVVAAMTDVEVVVVYPGVTDGRICGVVVAAIGLALLAGSVILWPRERLGARA